MFPFFYFYEFHTLYIFPPVQSEIASFDKFHLSHNGGLERLHSLYFFRLCNRRLLRSINFIYLTTAVGNGYTLRASSSRTPTSFTHFIIFPPVQSEIASFDKFHLSHNGGGVGWAYLPNEIRFAG